MAKEKSRHPAYRQTQTGTGIWHSEEFIFGITRGACEPAQRNSGRDGREPFDAGRSFEETYPSYPFSELVRLSIGLGNWLARIGSKPRQSFARSSGSIRAPAVGATTANVQDMTATGP